MSEPIPLLDALRKLRGARAAVLTTYNVWFPFFEGVVLPRLVGLGCRHVVLLADAGQVHDAMAHPETRPRAAGRRYTLVPVPGSPSFHPKVSLFLGDNRAGLWLGSHNLTLAGFNQNAEVTHRATDDEARALARVTWAAVRGWMPTAPPYADAAAAVERLAPWLAADVPGLPAGVAVRFAAPDRPALWEQVRPLLPDVVDRVTMVGPYFDPELAFVRHLCAALAPREVCIGLLPTQAQFPASKRHTLPGAVRCVDAETLLPGRKARADGSTDGRRLPFLHAKALLVEGEGRRVLVAGSANPSVAAWLVGPGGGNSEAVLVQDLAEPDPLGLHRLAGEPPLTETAWGQLPDTVPGLEASTRSASHPVAWVQGDRVDVVGAPPDTNNASLRDGSDAPLGSLRLEWCDGNLRLLPTDPADLQAAEVVALGDPDHPLLVPLHHPVLLARMARTGVEEQLMAALLTLETDHPDLVGCLRLIEPLLDQPVRSQRPPEGRRGQGGAGGRPEAGFGVGGGDSDIGLEEHLVAYGAQGELAHVMAYLHRRLPVATAPRERSEEESVGTEEDDLALVRVALVLEPAARRQIRERFVRLVTRLGHALPRGPATTATTAHEALAKVAAILGVARALRRLDGDRRSDAHEADDLLPFDAAQTLFELAVGACWREPAPLLALAIQHVGAHAAEIRSVVPLLVWLAHDIGEELPRRPTKNPMKLRRDADEDDLHHRYLWVQLATRGLADPSDRHAAREETLGASADEDAAAAGAWLDALDAFAAHLLSVLAEPAGVPAHGGWIEPGDLAVVGRGAQTRLRVVYKDRGSGKALLVEPEGVKFGSKGWVGVRVLSADAWPV